MLWDLVNLFMGSLPEDFEFLKAFGVLYILYILVMLFKLFWNLAYDFCKSIF